MRGVWIGSYGASGAENEIVREGADASGHESDARSENQRHVEVYAVSDLARVGHEHGHDDGDGTASACWSTDVDEAESLFFPGWKWATKTAGEPETAPRK